MNLKGCTIIARPFKREGVLMGFIKSVFVTAAIASTVGFFVGINPPDYKPPPPVAQAAPVTQAAPRKTDEQQRLDDILDHRMMMEIGDMKEHFDKYLAKVKLDRRCRETRSEGECDFLLRKPE